jgi:small basic protein (TIGR04137 family)
MIAAGSLGADRGRITISFEKVCRLGAMTTLHKRAGVNILLTESSSTRSIDLFDCDSGNLMTMDQSLKVQAGAIKTRNVLTRAERVSRLKELDRFNEDESVVGMPKVRVVKVSLKRKKKVKKEDDKK